MPSESKSDRSASPSRTGFSFVGEFQKDPNKAGFVVGVFVGLLTLVIIFVWSRRRSRRRSVVITGISESGKTLLFSQLLHRRAVETYTSMAENLGVYVLPNSTSVEVVDLPGNDKLRWASFERHKANARGVIFLVDSSTIKQELRNSAEFLFNVLSDQVIHRSRVPVLVVCNKQDAGIGVKGARVIEKELAREIGLLRNTHSRLLGATSSDAVSASAVFLGREGKEFEFAHLVNKVEFCEASSKGCDDKTSGIFRVRSWISSIA